MNKQVIAGVAVAPGEVVCGVHHGPAAEVKPLGTALAGDGQVMILMETRKTAWSHAYPGDDQHPPKVHGVGATNLPPVSEVLGKCSPYLQPNVEIPSCPVIGKGPNDHCKHGIGNLDFCTICEDDRDLTFTDMEI